MSRFRHLFPFAIALLGVAFLSVMDALMKAAATAHGAYTATLLRALFGAALIAPFWLAKGWHWPQTPVLKLHLERGTVSAFMALSFFYAITKIPLAEAIAISFVAPLIALYFARIFLGETIQPRAIWASILGLAGALIIVGGQFTRSELSRDFILGLCALGFSALLYAYNFTVIRKQSQRAGPIEIATFHTGVSGFVLLFAAPIYGTVLPVDALGLVFGAAIFTVAGSMAIAWAYARAEAQALVPAEYSSFLWASLLGWTMFDESVTAPTLAGTAIIVAACWIAARGPEPKPA
jgi:S-adenosylmethionine uptake transporter